MTGKKKTYIFLITYVLFLVLLFSTLSYGAVKIDSNMKQKAERISDNWDYELPRTNKRLSAPEFVKRYSMERGKEYTIHGWLPNDLADAGALYFYTQNIDLTMTLDGDKIYSIQSDYKGEITGAVENIVPLPSDAAGKEIIITFHSDSVYRYKLIEEVYLGEEMDFVMAVFKEQLPLAVLALVCFVIGTLQLAGGAWIKGDDYGQMVYLGSFSLLYSLWLFGCSGMTEFLTSYQYNGQNIRHLALALAAYPFLCYFELRFDIKKSFWNQFIRAAAFGNFTIVFVLHITGLMSLEESVILTFAILVVVFVYLASRIVRHSRAAAANYKKEKEWHSATFVGILLLAVSGCIDIFRFCFSMGLKWVYFSPSCFLILTTILSHRSIGAVMSTIQLGKNSESVKQLAYFDMLTQVYNRTALNEDMEQYEKTKKEKKSFGVVVFDVNNLKWVNDNLGHLAGDKLLQDSAAVIRDGFEEYGKTYRFGGDEFVVLLEEGAKEKFSFGIRQMESLLEKHNKQAKKDERITIAYGVAYYDGSDERTLWQVQEEADGHMYDRKKKMKARMHDGKDVRRD